MTEKGVYLNNNIQDLLILVNPKNVNKTIKFAVSIILKNYFNHLEDEYEMEILDIKTISHEVINVKIVMLDKIFILTNSGYYINNINEELHSYEELTILSEIFFKFFDLDLCYSTMELI